MKTANDQQIVRHILLLYNASRCRQMLYNIFVLLYNVSLLVQPILSTYCCTTIPVVPHSVEHLVDVFFAREVVSCSTALYCDTMCGDTGVVRYFPTNGIYQTSTGITVPIETAE